MKKSKKVLIAALLVSSLLISENTKSYAEDLNNEDSIMEFFKEKDPNISEDEETLEISEEVKKEALTSEKEINPMNKAPSEEEVKEYWHSYESKGENKENYNGIELTNQEDLYEVKPNLKTKEKGSLKQSVIDDTIHVLNTFRYSMGLDPVEEDKDLSEKAQAGAFINYANNEINHYPKTPEGFTDEDQVVKDGKLANSESNLAQGYSIYDTIGGYMDDENFDNSQVVGHRKWLMNPFLKRVGIGQVEEFNNIYVADDSAMSFNNDKIVAYPTKVNFTEFINPNTPFSVNLGIDYHINDIDNVKVIVTDKNGNVKTYTKDNGLFYSSGPHGNSKALIFGNELSKEKGSEYNIKVIGLKANEKDLPIEYTSKFISVNDKKKVVIPAKEIEDIAKPIEKPSIPWTEIEDNAEIIEDEKDQDPKEDDKSIPWTKIEDNAEIIDDQDDKDPDAPSKDPKEDDKSIPWTKIEDIANKTSRKQGATKDLDKKNNLRESNVYTVIDKKKVENLGNSNVNTGVKSLSSLLGILSVTIGSLIFTKKKN